MQVTIDRVLTFRINANKYVQEHTKEKEKSKFTHALEKMISRTNEIEKKYNTSIQDMRVEHASEDDKKNLIMDKDGQFAFTKENHKKLTIAIRAKLEDKVTIEPYWASFVPDDLGMALTEVFEDFVIKKEEEKPEKLSKTA